MDILLDSLMLLLSGDKELWSIVSVSLRVSLFAIFISIPVVFLFLFILLNHYWRFEKIIVTIIHTLTSIPAVVIGLVVYILLSRKGIFGDLNWLFTQKAMILGQVLLAFPIILSVSYSGFKMIDNIAKETAVTLGATKLQVFIILTFECRLILITAIVTAFGRIIAEVGSAMMVGGNILYYTRNITTAIALETSKGEFSQGIALGIILVSITFILNFLVLYIKKGNI